MYLKKEISISFFIMTISASNLYMPMIWSYVILLDFLIPFLCGPDLQCMAVMYSELITDTEVHLIFMFFHTGDTTGTHFIYY
jgi:hypothetical protein